MVYFISILIMVILVALLVLHEWIPFPTRINKITKDISFDIINTKEDDLVLLRELWGDDVIASFIMNPATVQPETSIIIPVIQHTTPETLIKSSVVRRNPYPNIKPHT